MPITNDQLPITNRRRTTLALLAAALLTPPAFADTITTPTGPYSGIITGLKNGKITLTIKSGEKQFDLTEITALSFDQTQYQKFNEAEAARDNALQASALYKTLISTLNNRDLKLLAQARAIDPLDRNGNWTDAVTNFLDVYASSPTDATWKLRPTHFPAQGSRLLTDSADRVAAAIKSAPTDDARKNLRTFLMEIYTRAGDAAAAGRIAREVAGLPEPAAPTAAAPDLTFTAALADLESALKNKNLDRVLDQTAKLLPTTDGQPAAQLFSLQARAYEAQNKPDLAAAAWLRIPAHYPDSPLAPTALLRAGTLEQQLNHPEAAKALFTELRTAYPASPEATTVKQP